MQAGCKFGNACFSMTPRTKGTKVQSFCFITPKLSGCLAANYKDIVIG